MTKTCRGVAAFYNGHAKPHRLSVTAPDTASASPEGVPLPASPPMLSADARNATTLATTIKGGNAAEKRGAALPHYTARCRRRLLPSTLIHGAAHATNGSGTTSVLTPFRGPKDEKQSGLSSRSSPTAGKYYDEPGGGALLQRPFSAQHVEEVVARYSAVLSEYVGRH